MIDDRYNDRYIVDTPEHVEFGYDVAGIGSRFLAALIDQFVISLIVTLLLLILTNVLGLDRGALIIVSAYALLVIGYYTLFERLWVGQTPGKRVLGIRVVQNEGRPVTFSSTIIRNLVRLADFIPFFYGLGVLTMFIDRRIRRLGDLAAGTLVVQDRQQITLESLVSARGPIFSQPEEASEGKPLLPNLQVLTQDDLALIRDFLGQRERLDPQRRQYLANQLAYALFMRLGYSVPGEPEQFILRVAAEHPQAMRS